MTDHCSLAAALAMCAAAGVAVLCAPQSRAQQAAPAHRERGNLVFENIPLADAALMARLERYQQSRQATFLDWLADGSLLVATRFGDSEQLHRVAAPLGMREQLTFYQDPIEWARAPRSGSGFVFLKDQGGDENAQLYYHGGGGEVRQLRPRTFGHRRPVWAPDGRGVYVLTDEDGEFIQLKLKDPVTHESRSVTPASGWDVEDFDVSSDGRYLAYVVDDDGRSRLTVLDTQAKLELAPVGLPEGRIGNLRFDRSGHRLALSAESAAAPRACYGYHLQHGNRRRRAPREPAPHAPATPP